MAVPSLSDLTEPGLEVEVPSLLEEPATPKEAAEVHAEILPLPSGADTGEVYLIIQPDTDPSLVLRFSQSVREIDGADIAFFTSSPRGIAIKLTVRGEVPILAILMELTELAEVEKVSYQERALVEDPNWGLPPFLKFNSTKAVGVILRDP